MIRDDWLLRQLDDLMQALAGARQEVHDQVELDGATATVEGICKQLIGLSLTAVRTLPVAAVLAAAGPLAGARRQALVQTLEIAGDLAEANGDAVAAAAFRERAAAL